MARSSASKAIISTTSDVKTHYDPENYKPMPDQMWVKKTTSAHSRLISLLIGQIARLQLDQRAAANRMSLPGTGANEIVPQTFARPAHPTGPPGRISHHKREVSDISCDDGTRSYETEFSK